MLPKILAVVGPTASGKTEWGIDLAQRHNGEVISVDSRQVYVGMDIGTGKVVGQKETGEKELGKMDIRDLMHPDHAVMVDGVAHWGIDLVKPDEEFSVAEFKAYAERKIEDILARGKVPILVGGTGLWIRAVVDNLDLPAVAPDSALREALEARSVDDLFQEFESLDPEGALEIDRMNKRRLVRALEVTKSTGKPFSALRRMGKSKYDVLQIGITVDREDLRSRIDGRVDAMVANGLVDEVRRLKTAYGCDVPSMSGIGYRQVCFFLDGKANLPAAIEDIKHDSWLYAKRQLTWFKKDERIQWCKNRVEAEAAVAAFMPSQA